MSFKTITANILWLSLTIGTSALAGTETVKSVPELAQAVKDECVINTPPNPQAQTVTAPDAAVRKTTKQSAPAVHPKVVFQINQTADAPTILRFVTNYLIAEPTAEVAVVGYGGGVDFMLKAAIDPARKPYAGQLRTLMDKGVAFKACNNTLKARSMTADTVVPGVIVVPGAVNEIIRLQTREGYAYFRH